MRSKIKNKFIASVMLTAFLATNTLTAGFAYDSYRPSIRGTEGATVSLSSGVAIQNGDSIVNLSLREADVTQVLRMFADQAGMNIIFADGLEGTVTMDLVDIRLSQAFDLVIKTSKLFYDIQGNTLVVSKADEAFSLSSAESISTVPVRYVNASALAHFINVNFFNAGSKTFNPGRSTTASLVTNPMTNEIIVAGTPADLELVRRMVEQFDKKPTITTFKVNHTTPAEMATSICTSFIPSAMHVTGGSSSGGAAGIATGFASDTAGSGISVGGGVSACSFSATNDSETEGADGDSKLISLPFWGLSVSYFPTQGTIQVIGGSDQQLQMIKDYIAMTDKKTPQAYLEVQIVSLNEAGSKAFDNQWTFLSKNFSFNAGSQAGGFQTNELYPIFWAGKGYDIVDGSSFPSQKIGEVGKWSGSPQLVYAVNYLISNQKARVLANPKVLLTNGQTSTIDLTSEYVDTVTTQFLTGSSTFGSSQTQKDISKGSDNGIKVDITPFISPDGYVTLDIKPTYNTIKSTYKDQATGDVLATLLQKRELDLKGVRIKDGETLVIGGIINETESKDITKIPFLGDIPVLGMFFRSTATNKEKEEMVMLITPQILVDTEDAMAEDYTL